MILVHTAPYNGTAHQYGQGWLMPKRGDEFAGGTCASLARLITRYVWSPHIWDDGKRGEANWRGCCWLVLDFDDGMSLWSAIAKFGQYRHVIGTTRSHGKLKHGRVCDRFRVALLLETPFFDLTTYKRSVAPIVNKLGADRACTDGARIFFPCVEIESSSDEGEFYPVPIAPPRAAAPRPRGLPMSGRQLRFETQGIYSEGSRNKEVFWWSCRLCEQGVAVEVAIARLAARTSLDEKEVSRTVRQAYATVAKAGPGNSGAARSLGRTSCPP